MNFTSKYYSCVKESHSTHSLTHSLVCPPSQLSLPAGRVRWRHSVGESALPPRHSRSHPPLPSCITQICFRRGAENSSQDWICESEFLNLSNRSLAHPTRRQHNSCFKIKRQWTTEWSFIVDIFFEVTKEVKSECIFTLR